jgi:phage-related minor tail protein
MAGPIYGEGFALLKPQLAPNFGSGVTAALGPIGAAAGAAILAGVGAAVGGGAVLAAIGGSFDDAFDTIRVGTGATGEALEGLKGEFRDVFRSVPTDMSTAATAIADLNTRLGLTGDDLEGLSAQFINMSRITKTDLGSNIETVTRTFGDWGVATEDMSGAMDMLFRASQATGPPVDRLGALLVQYGAPLRQLGFGFAESASLLGKFEKEGVNTELVMGSLRVALGKMARSGEDAQETFGRIVGDIESAGSASEANALALELFGARAGPDMAAAIREGRFELGELFDQVEGGSETIEKAAADTDDWRQSWQLFKNKALLALEPVATRVFNFLGDALDGLMSWWENDGPRIVASATAIWAGVVAAFDTVRPIIDAVMGAVRGFFDLFQGGGAALAAGGPLSGLTERFREIQPIIAQVVGVFRSGFDAIRAVVTTAVAIVSGIWERFGRHILSFISRTVGNILQVVRSVLQVVQGVFEVFAGIFTGDWDRFWGGIQQIVSGIWSAIQGIVKQAIEIVRTVIGAAMALISQIWSFAWNSIVTFLSGIWRGITGAVSAGVENVVQFFRDLPRKIMEALVGINTWLIEAGKDLIRGLISGIGSMAGQLGTAVGDMVHRNTVGRVKGLLGIESPSKVFADIGRDTVLGLIAGIDAEVPAARRAAENLASVTQIGATSGRASRMVSTVVAPHASEAARQLLGDVTIQQVAQDPESTVWELRKLAMEFA